MLSLFDLFSDASLSNVPCKCAIMNNTAIVLFIQNDRSSVLADSSESRLKMITYDFTSDVWETPVYVTPQEYKLDLEGEVTAFVPDSEPFVTVHNNEFVLAWLRSGVV